MAKLKERQRPDEAALVFNSLRLYKAVSCQTSKPSCCQRRQKLQSNKSIAIYLVLLLGTINTAFLGLPKLFCKESQNHFFLETILYTEICCVDRNKIDFIHFERTQCVSNNLESLLSRYIDKTSSNGIFQTHAITLPERRAYVRRIK